MRKLYRDKQFKANAEINVFVLEMPLQQKSFSLTKIVHQRQENFKILDPFLL